MTITAIYTPAINRRDWEENYRPDDKDLFDGLELPDNIFTFNYPIGEVVFDDATDRLTHESKKETPQPELSERWEIVQ